MRTSRLPALAAALGAMFALSGCIAAEVGAVGVGVDESGDVFAIAEGCTDPIQYAHLSQPGRRLTRWDLAEDVTPPDHLTWTLTGTKASAGMQSETQVNADDLEHQVTYTVYAGAKSHGVNIGSVSFTLGDLERLEPGQVLMPERAGASLSVNDNPLMVVSQQKFAILACSLDYRQGKPVS